jgi:hypothetical protein
MVINVDAAKAKDPFPPRLSFSPFLIEREVAFEQQLQRLQGLPDRDDQYDIQVFRICAFLVEVQSQRLWKNDPRYKDMDFYEFVLTVRNDKRWERNAIDRHLRIGKNYTEEAYLGYRRHGTGFTALSDLQRIKDPIMKAALLQVAAETQVTVLAVNKATKKDAPQPQTQDELAKKIRAELDAARSDPERRKRKRGSEESSESTVDPATAAEMERTKDEAKAKDERIARLEGEAKAKDEVIARKDEVIARKEEENAKLREKAEQPQAASAAIEAQQQHLDYLYSEAELVQRLSTRPPGMTIEEAMKQQGDQFVQAQMALRKDVATADRMRAEAQARLDAAGASEKQVESLRREVAAREREVEEKRQELARFEQELHNKAAALEAGKERLAAQQAALAKDQAAFADQCLANEKALAEKTAAHEKVLAEKTAAHEASLAEKTAAHEAALAEASAAEEAALAAKRAALGEDRRALDEDRRAVDEDRRAVDSDREDLLAQQTLLVSEKARLEPQRLALEAREQALDEGLFQLDLSRKDLLLEKSGLEEQHKYIRGDLSLLVRHAQQITSFSWHDQTWNVESTLNCFLSHVNQMCYLLPTLEKQVEEWKGPQGEPNDIVDTYVNLHNRMQGLPKELARVSRLAIDECHARFPRQVEARLEEITIENQRVAQGGKPAHIEPIRLQNVRVAPRFSFPIAALLGSARPDSPVQIALGKLKEGGLVTVDMNTPQSIAIIGEQDTGKSTTAQGIMEAVLPSAGIDNICCGGGDTAVIYFHFNNEPGAPPVPLTIWLKPNDEAHCVEALSSGYRARPRGMSPRRTLVYSYFTSEEELLVVQSDYPLAEVRPMKFTFKNLGATGVRLFMAAAKNSALYMRKIDIILAQLKDFTLEGFLKAIAEINWTKQQWALVMDRVEAMKLFVHDGVDFAHDLRPGDLCVIDMRSPKVEPALALTVFTCAQRSVPFIKIPALDKDGNEQTDEKGKTLMRSFKKLCVYDECHRYLLPDHPCTVETINTMKEMRSKETTTVLITQDPKALPGAVLRHTTLTLLHRIKSTEALNYLARHVGAFAAEPAQVLIKRLLTMEQGHYLAVASNCAELRFKTGPQEVHGRPPLSKPGGTTRKSIDDEAEAQDQGEGEAEE